jgi:hypothetical protein
MEVEKAICVGAERIRGISGGSSGKTGTDNSKYRHSNIRFGGGGKSETAATGPLLGFLLLSHSRASLAVDSPRKNQTEETKLFIKSIKHF